MLFNSASFAVFFPIVYLIYWGLSKKNFRYQNILLLVSSYYFYANWDWRFLFLLIFSTGLDFFTGAKIHCAHSKNARLTWLWISIVINLGFLGVFKYFNFFIASFNDLLGLFGLASSELVLQVILPVGISFYTFHGLSYVVDIYNRKIEPEPDIINYSVFVSYFPLLVAGPIERATHLLPQIKRQRTFSYDKSVDGLRQVLWGLFKKMVIADNCAGYVNEIFENYTHYNGATLFLGAVLFAFQIYGDFSGYSDIALGVSRLLGIELLRNFSFPYFSRDIAEFWRRWHISLSSWFKDYLYIPLGGSKGGKWMSVRNTFIIFIVSGFWHGANWTFVFWGFLNALYFMPLLLSGSNRKNIEIVAVNSFFSGFKDLLKIVKTFFLTVIAWVFFRASDLPAAFDIIGRIFSKSLFLLPDFPSKFNKEYLIIHFSLIFYLIIQEWKQKDNRYGLEKLSNNIWKRWIIYLALSLMIFLFAGKEQAFIYFQF